MRVLLTNDDGIFAPGIVALHDALLAGPTPLATELMVVAPHTVQSATGHGVTFRTPLMTRPVRMADHGAQRGTPGKAISVDGRPADCTKLGIAALWPEHYGELAKPDLVVSGINIGCNVGINVLYSGTVAAALEGAFLGVPAAALSLHIGKGTTDWPLAATRAVTTLRHVLGTGLLTSHGCVNINIPRTETESATSRQSQPPMVVAPMNTHGSVDAFSRHQNPIGETYFWSAGSPMEFHATEPGSDVDALLAGNITVTPLNFDMTDRVKLAAWAAALADRPSR